MQSNVLYVHGLKRNILSVSQITEQNFKAYINANTCVTKGKENHYRVVAVGYEDAGLYRFAAKTAKHYVLVGAGGFGDNFGTRGMTI
jgi:hypothetical protein